MTKTWLKATLAVQMESDTEEKRKQSFTAIVQDASEQQLTAFSKVLETLTGDSFVAANITNAFRYNTVA